jgi:CubicO group peptidase (beta-lactamase class C family)
MDATSHAVLPRTARVVEDGLASGLHIGAQVYVERGGRVEADLAFGDARPGVPMERDTIMLWLSAGKPVAAVAIGQLWEQGQLELDDRVSRYLPAFSAHGKQAITIRHLLTHTAGFRALRLDWPGAPWDSILARIADARIEPGWVPGRTAGYHPASSWFVLGELIRVIDGRSYSAYVREEVFLPLGMDHCYVGMSEADLDRLGAQVGVLHRTERGEPSPHPYHRTIAGYLATHPGANAHGPIRELGRLYRMLLNHGDCAGTAVLQPETARTLVRRHRTGEMDRTFKYPLDWGLGFLINTPNPSGDIIPYGYGAHASPDAFGHSGAETSCGFADPRDNLVVCWLCNGGPGERRHQRRQHAINGAIYEDLGLDAAGPRALGCPVP